MRFHVFMWGLTLSAILSGGVRAGDAPVPEKVEAEVVVDFGALEPDVVRMPYAEKGQSAHKGNVAEKAALQLEWNRAEAPWCTVQFGRKMPVAAEGKLHFALRLFRPKESTVRRTSLFVVDRDNEVFQLVAELPVPPGAWETVDFELDPVAPKANIWGGTVENRVPDAPLRIQGVSCTHTGKAGTETAALGPLTVRPATAPIQAALVTGDDLPLVVPGREGELRLVLHNPGLAPREAVFEYRLHDPEDREVVRDRLPVALAGGTARAIPLPAPAQFGVHTVRWRVTDPAAHDDSDGNATTVADQPPHRFAYMAPAGPAAFPRKGGTDAEGRTVFFFGVCAHPQRYPSADRRRMARAAGLCGVELVRFALEVERLNPREGVWTFDTYDDVARVLAENNLAFAPIFMGMPAWADAADWTPAVPNNSPRGHRPDHRHWADFIRTFAGHYRPHMRFAEIWNEPDLIPFANFGPGEYLELLRIASPILRDAVPGITLFSAGFATPDQNPPGRTADPAYVRKSVEGGRGLYDIFAVHMHATPARFRDHYLPALARFRRETDDKTPWYANETGLPVYGGITEQRQAETLFINLLRAWAHGAIGFNWYNLRDTRHDAGDPEANYGLLTHDFQPKPAFVAYNTLARYFRGATLSARGANDDGRLVFRAADGAWLVPVWREDTARGDALRMVTGVDGDVSIIDLWGNAQNAKGENGVFLFAVPERPVILRFAGQARAPTPEGAFITYDESVRLRPGEDRTVVYTCRNPSTEPLRVDFAFAPTPGLAVTPASRRATIPPGGETPSTFTFRLARGHRPEPLPLAVTVEGVWSGTLAIRPEILLSVPAGAFAPEPALALRSPEQVHPLMPVEGSYAHLQWRGPGDLSADVHVARDTDALRVRVVVADDIHAQPFGGVDAWKGDNVQLGLQLPRQRGLWDIGLTHGADGDPEVFVWLQPEGYDAAAAAGQIRLATRRDDAAGTTTYEAVLPFRAVGLTDGIGREGFQLNVLVNDNDGEGRENAIAAAPGMLDKDAARFPWFCF